MPAVTEKACSAIRFPYAVQNNGLSNRPFSFLVYYRDQNGGQNLGKYVYWKEPKLYKGKDKWWIEYQFRIPEELRYRYKGARWKGFKVYEDINRYKTEEYAALLITAVRSALEHGFNPFELAKETFIEFHEQTPAQQQQAKSGLARKPLITSFRNGNSGGWKKPP